MAMKCVPIYPFVLAPQMKKVRNNSQKSRLDAALLSAAKAIMMGLMPVCADSLGASPTSPMRRSPTAWGVSGSSIATMGNVIATATATRSTSCRQP